MQYKGIEYRLCALTNLYLAQMNDFVKVFFQGVKPEEKEEKEEDSEELYCPRCGTMYPDPVRKICPKCMNKRSIFTRALGYFWKYRAKMTALFLCYIFSAFINLLWPYLSGTVLFDWVLNKNGENWNRRGIYAGPSYPGCGNDRGKNFTTRCDTCAGSIDGAGRGRYGT